MQAIQHWAILTSNHSDKRSWLKPLLKGKSLKNLESFAGLQGALFSNDALEKFIEAEVRHDRHQIESHHGLGVRFLSNGEQKKALLAYLISTQPDFLIIDNTFDYLDPAKRAELVTTLESLAQKIPILQIVYRAKDVLPFIKRGFCMVQENAVFQESIQAYFQKTQSGPALDLNQKIPIIHTKFQQANEVLIKLNKVSVSYNERPILTDISWEIRSGQFWQLVGPNGSGKTTLLSLITGDNVKGYGQDITLFGWKKGSGESVWDIKKKIGYFTPAMTNRFKRRESTENMILSGLSDSIGLYKKYPENHYAQARAWLNALSMLEFKDTVFQELTEGQQRLVMIARAMIKQPPLLILDEPTSGLDDRNIDLFKVLVNKIADETNTAIIYVSHRLESGLNPQFTFKLK